MKTGNIYIYGYIYIYIYKEYLLLLDTWLTELEQSIFVD